MDFIDDRLDGEVVTGENLFQEGGIFVLKLTFDENVRYADYDSRILGF